MSKRKLVSINSLRGDGTYRTRWFCPWCMKVWSIRPKTLTKCECGAVMDREGLVEFPNNKKTPPFGMPIQDKIDKTE